MLSLSRYSRSLYEQLAASGLGIRSLTILSLSLEHRKSQHTTPSINIIHNLTMNLCQSISQVVPCLRFHPLQHPQSFYDIKLYLGCIADTRCRGGHFRQPQLRAPGIVAELSPQLGLDPSPLPIRQSCSPKQPGPPILPDIAGETSCAQGGSHHGRCMQGLCHGCKPRRLKLPVPPS